MRIAVVHNLRSGGARRRLVETLAFLGNHEVREFCLGTAEPVTLDANVTPYWEKASQVKPFLRPALRYLDVNRLLLAWRKCMLQASAWEPDVLFLNPCQFLQCPPFRPQAIKTVYYCDEPRRADYDMAARRSIRRSTYFIYGPLRFARRRLDRHAVRRCSRILTNSRFTQDRISLAYGVIAEVVYLGVGSKFRPSAIQVTRSGYLSVGPLIHSKGHRLCINVLSELGAPQKLTIVASRKDVEEERDLQRLARVKGVQLEILFDVSDRHLVELYQRSIATIYLAEAEPWGLVSLESQACGTPVLVSAEGGLPETIVHGDTGFAVDRANSHGAANALRRLHASDVWDRMSEAAVGHASAFTWAVTSKVVLKHFEEVCEYGCR